MILSTLEQDEKAIIRKVGGNGAFRKRIVEMGFVSGQEIRVIKKAPFKDPVEYNVMGYNVSLRREEADLIEVEKYFDFKTESNVKEINDIENNSVFQRDIIPGEINSKTLNIALVGNPNSGKTTFFNHASSSKERVANYAGATVESKEAKLKQGGYTFNITDLPGTYSITSYTPEEQFVREEIINKAPDYVINVLDSSNLERNLYLTMQLIEMDIQVVVAVNMYDELLGNGESLDIDKLEKLLGVPVIPTVGTKGTGVSEVFDSIIELQEGKRIARYIQINYGRSAEKAISVLTEELKLHNINLPKDISSRFLAVKLLEKDAWTQNIIGSLSKGNEILLLADKEIQRIENEFNNDSESIITDSKYGFIAGALKETFIAGVMEKHRVTRLVDNILMHRVFSIPIFFFLMWLTFYSTFTLGAYPMEWLDSLMGSMAGFFDTAMSNGILKDFLVDGIIGGVGGVIIFLPNIFILFFFISLMEDTGYMSRTVFLMDRLMHKVGLHGKSFIPLLMGFGCNVPAIMATRTIESKRDRLVTMLIIPFMSCSARLPVYVLFIGAFYPNIQGTMLFLLYLIGIVISLLSAIIMNKTVFKKADMPFVMELPPYRMPTMKALSKHVWFKGAHYIKKMGGIILIASTIIWVLGYFPRDVEYTSDYDAQISNLEQKHEAQMNFFNGVDSDQTKHIVEKYNDNLKKITIKKESERQAKSILGRIGKTIEPVFKPLGFDWRMSISILTGMAAKEIVVSSMGVLYQADMEADETNTTLINKLQEQTYQSGDKAGQKIITPISALAFMLFILLYFPCVASLVAIKRESGGWKWMLFSIFYTTTVAWIVSFTVYQVGSLFA